MKTKTGNQPITQQCDLESHSMSDEASHSLPYIHSSRGRDPRQVRSAEALRGALLRLLERKAFDQITVREIAAEAGVHNATFFRHHPDKEALLDHVAKDEIDRLVAVSLPAGHGLEGYMTLCEYVSSHRILWTALLTGGAGGAMREQFMRLSKAVAADHIGIESWLPHELSVICSTTLIVETISWWLTLDENAYSPKEIAQILDRLVSAAVTRSPLERKKPARKSGS